MNIIQKNNYNLISSNESSFEIFIENFDENYTNLKGKHLIVEISPKNNFTEKNILVFLKYADLQQQSGTSFVVICNEVNVDNFPEFFNIVPTLVEAEDIIEMEDIQRDLGF
ncbi:MULTISPECIES: hypothetical protein [Tenacibaculum]|uniref:hypothetical protein n=1 Tax=Tenacibaculum TaxID=104267 RepID=UPI000DE82A59|nr:hypothetical protein [Tenacibaculum sp. E3R01]RBW63218.1 hypothetical protein DS884_00670 [Tenacibaculum sp. E3R01]